MGTRLLVSGSITLTLAGCAAVSTSDGSISYIEELPEAVLQAAAPYQDLTAVMIEPSDGCYVYRHVGPVETTLIPLRTVSGRPICTRPQTTEADPSAQQS